VKEKMQKQRPSLEEPLLPNVVVVKGKMKKFDRKRANRIVVGVVLAEDKFLKIAFCPSY